MHLQFIYNAKLGNLNTLLDVAHKIISPKTYQCKLCALTHDTFSENKLWKEFRYNTTLSLEFLHSDEFEEHYPKEKFNYPVIILKEKNTLTELMSASEIEKLKTTEELIQAINIKTKNFSSHD